MSGNSQIPPSKQQLSSVSTSSHVVPTVIGNLIVTTQETSSDAVPNHLCNVPNLLSYTKEPTYFVNKRNNTVSSTDQHLRTVPVYVQKFSAQIKPNAATFKVHQNNYVASSSHTPTSILGLDNDSTFTDFFTSSGHENPKEFRPRLIKHDIQKNEEISSCRCQYNFQNENMSEDEQKLPNRLGMEEENFKDKGQAFCVKAKYDYSVSNDVNKNHSDYKLASSKLDDIVSEKSIARKINVDFSSLGSVERDEKNLKANEIDEKERNNRRFKEEKQNEDKPKDKSYKKNVFIQGNETTKQRNLEYNVTQEEEKMKNVDQNSDENKTDNEQYSEEKAETMKTSDSNNRLQTEENAKNSTSLEKQSSEYVDGQIIQGKNDKEMMKENEGRLDGERSQYITQNMNEEDTRDEYNNGVNGKKEGGVSAEEEDKISKKVVRFKDDSSLANENKQTPETKSTNTSDLEDGGSHDSQKDFIVNQTTNYLSLGSFNPNHIPDLSQKTAKSNNDTSVKTGCTILTNVDFINHPLILDESREFSMCILSNKFMDKIECNENILKRENFEDECRSDKKILSNKSTTENDIREIIVRMIWSMLESILDKVEIVESMKEKK